MFLLIFLIHLLTTLMMTGILWFVQVVHYPLMSLVGKEAFQRYESQHVTFTGYLLVPIMLIEVTSALLLAFFTERISLELMLGNLGLLIFIWLSTFLKQVPLHNRLMQGFERSTWQTLTRSNWFRTIAWTLRSVLLCVYLYLELR